MFRYLFTACCLGALLLLLTGCGKKAATVPTNVPKTAPAGTPAAATPGTTPGLTPGVTPGITPTGAGVQPSSGPPPTGGVTPTGGVVGIDSSSVVSTHPEDAATDPGFKSVPSNIPRDANGQPMTRAKRLEQLRLQGASMDRLSDESPTATTQPAPK